MKKAMAVLPHILFWGAFTLLFWLQNPDAEFQDYAKWFLVLGVAAVVVYVNLYYLLPTYFFRKKYVLYSAGLVFVIGLGAVGLRFIFLTGDNLFTSSAFEHFTNLFFFVLITSSFKFSREYLKKQGLLLKSENAQLRAELSLLKSQVSPHFLFNTLNNLYGLIVQNQNQQAAEALLQLSDLMRYLLQSSKADKVRLKEEILFIEDYLNLEKIRLSKNADIKWEVSGMDNETDIAPLLFIPLVENAFKHGLHLVSDKSFAHFSLSLQGNDLFFEAHNSLGKSLEKTQKSGTGLDNLRKRLKLVYPNNHQLETERTESFFKATLHIEL
ncbi:histidine kinase [Phaeodactylibacter sp.]|uniref:sensor histidine kinase n=1 Tax=Phaeodactylibacter sp. TaxID=1940289 RepID=UPI0025D9DA73|nr:histidine kinase [Phaeodactylibacter sp.]MCI5058083.1 histidine kinase [Flavobacteriales bacterium]MCI5090922.1 histidine kinase [Phaeodactylibacter sp.]